MPELIVVGDRVLIEPRAGEQRTDSGLLLPASVAEQENVRVGRVVRTGPGYLTANPEYSEGETWKEAAPVRYLPLQAQPSDTAFFLKEKAVELRYQEARYLIVPHAAILALVRGDAETPSGATFDDLESLLGG